MKETPLGSLGACLFMRVIPAIELKDHSSRWESKLGLFLFRSMTETGVIVALSSQVMLMGCRMYSSKTLRGWRLAVAGVLLRFLNTSFCAVLSSSLCQWDSKSFCFRISFTLEFIASWESSAGLSFSSWNSLIVSVRVEFVVEISSFWALMRDVVIFIN